MKLFDGSVSYAKGQQLYRTWTHIRRLVASMMLVGLASFVLHGSAMARTTPMHSPARAATHHGDGTHDHATAAYHVHAGTQAADADGGGDAPNHHGPGACCGSFCAVAIAPVVRAAEITRLETAAVLPELQVDGRGIAHEGLRKPPRTPDIA